MFSNSQPIVFYRYSERKGWFLFSLTDIFVGQKEAKGNGRQFSSKIIDGISGGYMKGRFGGPADQ